MIVNGGYETGSFPPWVIQNSQPPPFVAAASSGYPVRSGVFSAHVGSLPGSETNGNSSFYQTITVPAAGGTLSYWYWPRTTDTIAHDWQDAYVTDPSGQIQATIMHNCSNSQGWINVTFNMAPYRGQQVRIKFLVHATRHGSPFGQDNPTDMFVDDVVLLCP